ncbi:MAG: hypothetical protein JOZ21_02155 [Verrucomicrobia bacterium]|nr:hypothetical protein [Verrucomicrobiota bacterium]
MANIRLPSRNVFNATAIMELSDEAYRNFQRRVDRLCVLIVSSDCSDQEIQIERLHLRVQAATLFPEKLPLYDMVYEGRFDRLSEQFRGCIRRCEVRTRSRASGCARS